MSKKYKLPILKNIDLTNINFPCYFINAIPNDIHTKISGFLEESTPHRDVTSIAITCKHLYSIYHPYIDDHSGKMLLNFVFNNNKELVLEKLKRDPSLLTYKGKIIHPICKYEMYGTALQIAAGTLNLELVKAILPFYKKNPHGSKLKKDHLNEQFPDDYDITKYDKFDFNMLLDIIFKDESIKYHDEKNEYQMNDHTRYALIEFQHYFKKLTSETMAYGLYCNPLHYLDLQKAFHNYKFLSHDKPQNDLVHIHIEGFLLRFFPLCYFKKLNEKVYQNISNKILYYDEGLGMHYSYSLNEATHYHLITPNVTIDYEEQRSNEEMLIIIEDDFTELDKVIGQNKKYMRFTLS